MDLTDALYDLLCVLCSFYTAHEIRKVRSVYSFSTKNVWVSVYPVSPKTKLFFTLQSLLFKLGVGLFHVSLAEALLKGARRIQKVHTVTIVSYETFNPHFDLYLIPWSRFLLGKWTLFRIKRKIPSLSSIIHIHPMIRSSIHPEK